MIKFYIFRMKVERDFRPLLEAQYSFSRNLIKSAVEERPRKVFRTGQEWLVGNVEEVTKDRLLFAFGKITKSISERYNFETKDFADITEEQAPYTYVAIDLHNQVCAIAYKAKIAPRISILSDRLARTLSSTSIAVNSNVRFVLPAIQDTENLLKVIQNAVRIKKLELTFSPPNPWDVEKDFHKPQEELLQMINGKSGKTSVEGDMLKKSVLKKIIRSIASTGDTASIRAKMPNSSRFVKKELRGSHANFFCARRFL